MPFRAGSEAKRRDQTGGFHLFERTAQAIAADAGAQALQVGTVKSPVIFSVVLAQQIGLRAARRFDLRDPLLEFAMGPPS